MMGTRKKIFGMGVVIDIDDDDRLYYDCTDLEHLTEPKHFLYTLRALDKVRDFLFEQYFKKIGMSITKDTEHFTRK